MMSSTVTKNTMRADYLLTAFLLSLLLHSASQQTIPEVNCPDIFRYSFDPSLGGYYGRISLEKDGSATSELQVNMSVTTQTPVNTNIKIVVLSKRDELIFGKKILYAVQLPIQDVLPKLTLIRFNGRILCRGDPDPLEPGVIQTSMWARSTITTFSQAVADQPTTQKSPNGFFVNVGAQPNTNPFGVVDNPFLSNNYPFNNNNNNNNNNNDNNIKPNTPPAKQSPPPRPEVTTPPKINTVSRLSEQCGSTRDTVNLIIGGEDINPGDFPWLTAIMYRRKSDYKFHCTGNLLSDRHVLTAGHCVRYHNAPLFPNEDLIIVLGKLNIENWASGSTLRNPGVITAHPNYKQDVVDYDIAVIVLDDPVRFKPTVRPICLWDGSDNLDEVIGRFGSVVGWSKDSQDGLSTSAPRKIEMPIVSQENCLRSHKVFAKYTSPRTFCAGNRDNISGPCNGDSGAGFMIRDDVSKKWYLRGLVGFAIRDPDTFSCDLGNYAVFIDVAKLRPWIREEMNKER